MLFGNINNNLPLLQKHVPQTGYSRRSSRFEFYKIENKNNRTNLEEGFLGIKHSISQIGKMYLDFLEYKYKLYIRREVKIGQGITVDGLIDRLDTEGIPLFVGVPLLTRIVLEIEGIENSFFHHSNFSYFYVACIMDVCCVGRSKLSIRLQN